MNISVLCEIACITSTQLSDSSLLGSTCWGWRCRNERGEYCEKQRGNGAYLGWKNLRSQCIWLTKSRPVQQRALEQGFATRGILCWAETARPLLVIGQGQPRNSVVSFQKVRWLLKVLIAEGCQINTPFAAGLQVLASRGIRMTHLCSSQRSTEFGG